MHLLPRVVPPRLIFLGLCTRKCQCRHQSMSKETEREIERALFFGFLDLSLLSLAPSFFFGLFHSFPCHYCVSPLSSTDAASVQLGGTLQCQYDYVAQQCAALYHRSVILRFLVVTVLIGMKSLRDRHNAFSIQSCQKAVSPSITFII